MKKKIRLKPLAKIFLSIFIALVLIFSKYTYSRYSESAVNTSDLQLAPWSIVINEQKVYSAGETNIIVNPVITEVTTNTNTYKNKLVPGCKGYFDVEINPTGTGVAVDFVIDFKPENLLGGMKYTAYATLDSNKSIVSTYTSFPINGKLMGTMTLVDGNLLNENNILRYRVFFDYVDDDSLNTNAADVDTKSGLLITVSLNQSV